jgi:hypothetical protein
MSSIGDRAILIRIPPKEVPGGRIEYPASASIPQRPSYWLTLPRGSILTLPATLDGMFVPAPVQLIALAPDNIWVVPERQQEDYFLTGTLQVPRHWDIGHQISWGGTLKLPKLRIPMPDRPPAKQ